MSSSNHPDLNRSTTEPFSIVPSGCADGSTTIRPELARTRSQMEKTADQSQYWSKENRNKSMASRLEYQYQNATTDTEKLSILEKCFVNGLITGQESTYQKIALSDKTGGFSSSSTTEIESKIRFVEEALRGGFISEKDKTKYTLRLSGLSSLSQDIRTKDEKLTLIDLIDEARREGYINDSKAEEYIKALAY